MDLNGDQPPFWSQPTTSMPRRRSSAPLLTLPILIVVIPIIVLLLLFFIVPPFLSLTSQIFRPYNIVKKGWDSLNILLVLFAILCGIFPRRNDNGSTPADSANNLNNVSDISDGMDTTNLSNPQKWFDDDQYPNTKVCDRPISTPVTGRSRLRRSSSSYPDMRQDSHWETGEDRFRFFDDLRIRQSHRSPDNNVHQLRRTRSDFEEYSDVKVIAVDSFLLRSSHAPPPKSPTPPRPPPPPAVRQRPRRAYQNVGRKDMSVESDVDVKKAESPPVPPAPPPPPQRAPPPPPLPEQMSYRSEQKCVKIEHRKSNTTKEIKMVLASLYNQRKRIKRKHKTNYIEEYSKSVHSPPQYSNIPPPSPPPPPLPLPPHPSSVFQNLFKKSSKSKKVHSVPPPAPPPPPPPRSSNRKSQARPPIPPPPPPVPPTPPLQPYRRRNAATSGKPPLPAGANNSYDENLNRGNQSPQIPVPPPPPPFKTSEFRFVVRGDFVNIHSARNSRCSSPDPKEVDNDILSTKESTAEKVNAMDGGDEVGSVFCPSPDVNVKADTFIARLRDGWRLEKMNSLREKQNMGPGPR